MEENQVKARDEPEKTKLEKREILVKKEKNRLKSLYKDIPENKKKVVEGLIMQASRLKILLDEMWIDITEKGDYELFSQSEKQEPYERERPVAKLYNARNDSYQRITKQLIDLLPEPRRIDEGGKPDGSDLL